MLRHCQHPVPQVELSVGSTPELCPQQGSHFVSQHILIKTMLPCHSNNFHRCSLLASVLEDEVLHLSVASDLKNDLVDVMVLHNVAEVQQAKMEIFHLPSAIRTGKN